MNLREKIEKTLNTKEESNRKTVSVTLDAAMLEKVDNVAKSFSRVTEKTYSRNSIVELAIQEYIAEAGQVLSDTYGIDIGVEIEEDNDIGNFDLVIFPAHNDGFNETFLGENQWYSVRMKEDKIPKIKYIAAYRAAPISGITHYAKVKEIEQYKDTEKKIVIFDGTAIKLPQTIKLGETNANAMRAPRYTTLSKLQNAKEVSDLF